jgi:multimeric flavodoxin WrbA
MGARRIPPPCDGRLTPLAENALRRGRHVPFSSTTPHAARAGAARRLTGRAVTTPADPVPPSFDGLSALFINCSLKRSPEISHTDGLVARSAALMRSHGVAVSTVRAADHDIATGVWPDMTEHGADSDDWPALGRQVLAADILVLAGPIWLGDNSSVMKRVIERLYGCSSLLNEHSQYAYYGRAGGCLLTGNEDGVKHCAMNILYSLQHLGYCIPPQADAGWIGTVGPGPSYLDEGSGGPESDFTNRNTAFMTFNLLHLAALLKQRGGFPAYGNQPSAWDAGTAPGQPNPEYR